MGRFFSWFNYRRSLICVTAMGLLLRLIFINQQPLWRDEAFTGLAVRRSWANMLSVVAHDSAPPLFYLVERFVALFSTSPLALRLYPVLAGVAAIPLAAALGRRLAGPAGGLSAGLVAAFAPTLLLTSLDARMYQPALTLVLAACLCLLRAQEKPSLARWALYAAVVILALYTVYFALFPVLAMLLTALLLPGPHTRRTRLAILASTALALLACVPWLLYAKAQFTHQGFWVPPLTPATLVSGLAQFYTPLPNLSRLSPSALLAGLTLLVGLGLTAALLFRLYRHPPARDSPALFLACIGLFGLAAILLLSLRRPFEDARFLAVAWVPLYPLFAAQLTRLRLPRLQILGPSLLLASSLGLALAVTNPATPTDLLGLRPSQNASSPIYASPSTYLLLLYYAPPPLAAHIHVLGPHVLWFWGTAVYPPNAIVANLAPSPPSGKILYVSSPSEGLPSQLIHLDIIKRTCFPAICTTIFDPPTTR